MDEEDRLQRKLQESVNAMLEKLERERLRPFQAKVHRRIADCYTNQSASAHEVESCANNSTIPLRNIQNQIQNEMGQFQEKLTRCSMVCQDEITQKYDLNGSPSERNQEAARKALLGCVNNCVDKHIALLNSIHSNLEKNIANITNNYK